MRRVDAPPAGWYPDPRGGARLRWWDGTDWTDHWRAPPSSAERQMRAIKRGSPDAAGPTPTMPVVPSTTAQLDRATAQEIIAEVRKVARSEIDRAADVFTQRAKAATREIQPLVSEYTNRLLLWLRIIAVVALVLVVAWFVFQAVAQVSFFEWIGERIDNLTD